MCGIAGIITSGARVQQQQVKVMTDVLQHRGPQGEGFWLHENGHVAFGHRRLSILDLSDCAAQPMVYGTYTITYNGELYNYLELKADLKAKGYRFGSAGDTEVVVAAYACYGAGCLQHFDGMFAFAIWDDQQQQLFCARDRFGEKPFYYHYNGTNHTFTFASEMKALWAAGVERKINNSRLLNYLSLGWVESAVNKHETFYENVASLPPAHALVFVPAANGSPSLKVKSYWDIDKTIQNKAISEREAVDMFSALLEISIRRRLRSDVTIGSSLSGGLDSSTVVAMINRLQDGNRQETFSAVFPGFARDESQHIDLVAGAFNVANHTTTPGATGFIDELERLVWHQEEPFQSASIYAQYKVYELAKQHGVTVILDGQGADETLAGYTKYYHWYWQQLFAAGHRRAAAYERQKAAENGHSIPWGIKNIIAAYLPQVAANSLERKAFRQLQTQPFVTRSFAEHADRDSMYKPAISSLNDVLYFNCMQFGLTELLRYADRNAMAHSREVRLPFLSHELVEFVFSLPATMKIKEGFTKYLLRQSMNGRLADSVVWRKDKVGFEPPQKQWMQHAAFAEVLQQSRSKLVSNGILDKHVLKQPVSAQDAHEPGNFDFRVVCAAMCL